MDHQKKIFLASIALLAVAVCAVYFQALSAPLVFDDHGSVGDNRSIIQLWPLVGDAANPGPLNPPPNTPTSGRPLVNLSLAINYYFGQLNPVGYHVFNLILHVMSAVLLMSIMRRTLCLDYFEGRFADSASSLALAVALVWALHPLQTEPVVYITQRTELMVGFFYLATLYCSLRYWVATTPAARNGWLTLGTLASLAGMASKEVMATAPVIVLLFERTFIAGSFRRALRNSWPLYVGLFGSWSLLLWLNWSGPRSHTAGFHLEVPAYSWWFTQSKMLWLYLRLTVWPWPQAVYYQMPYLITLRVAWPWLTATLLLTLGVLILAWRRTAIGFVGAWVLLILSPTLIVPIMTEVAAERRMYLPLAALTALVVVGFYALVQRLMHRSAAKGVKHDESSDRHIGVIAIIALLLAVVMGVASVRRLEVYHDELTLWQDVVASQPKNFIAHSNLGLQLFHHGRTEEAMKEYRKAIELKPEFPDPYDNLGNALLTLDRAPEAIACFEEALRLNPDYAGARNNLGNALANMGKLTEAIDQYREAVKIKPELADAYNNWATVLVRLNRPQEAVERFEQALHYKPSYADAHSSLAGVLISLGRNQEAIDHCRQALLAKPDHLEAHCNLGVALAKLGKLPEAIAEYQEALKLDPNYFNGHYNLGNALFEAGDPQAAVEQFQRAIQINPDDAQAHYNLGNALLQIDRRDDAIEQYQAAVKIKPDYAEAHNNLGSTLLRAGRVQEAIEQYQQTVELMPNHPKAYKNLANAYAQVQRFSEAIAAAQKALDLARSAGQTDLSEQIETGLKNYRAELAKRPGEATHSSGDRAVP